METYSFQILRAENSDKGQVPLFIDVCEAQREPRAGESTEKNAIIRDEVYQTK